MRKWLCLSPLPPRYLSLQHLIASRLLPCSWFLCPSSAQLTLSQAHVRMHHPVMKSAVTQCHGKSPSQSKAGFHSHYGQEALHAPLGAHWKDLQSRAKPVSGTLWWDNTLNFQPLPRAMHTVLKFLTLWSDGSSWRPRVSVSWCERAESLTTVSLSHIQIHRAHQQLTQQLSAAHNK